VARRVHHETDRPANLDPGRQTRHERSPVASSDSELVTSQSPDSPLRYRAPDPRWPQDRKCGQLNLKRHPPANPLEAVSQPSRPGRRATQTN